MKSMSNYILYCTHEQVKRAYVLGAPLMMLGYGDLGDKKDEILSFNKQVELSTTEDGGIIVCQTPTAEQMQGWIRDKGVDCFVGKQTYARFFATTTTHVGEYIYSKKFDTYQEAILAAIDAALDYLKK